MFLLKKFYRQNSYGRSMIEMLGVLAVIGVLSIGGIVSYSKAMQQHKYNQLLDEYTHFINGLIPHKKSLESGTLGGSIKFSALEALGVLPATWQTDKILSLNATDSLGNSIILLYDDSTETGMFGVKDKFLDLRISLLPQNKEDCIKLMSSLVQPLAPILSAVSIWPESGTQKYVAGNSTCGIMNIPAKFSYSDRSCLTQASLADFTQTCSSSQYIVLDLYF